MCVVKVKNVRLTQSDVHIARLKGPVHSIRSRVQGAAWSQSVGVSGEASLCMFAYLFFFKAFKTVGTYYLFKILNYKNISCPVATHCGALLKRSGRYGAVGQVHRTGRAATAAAGAL